MYIDCRDLDHNTPRKFVLLTIGGSKTHLVTGDSEIVAAVLHYSCIKFTGEKTTGQPR